jgi:hypothetical protein
MPWEILEYNSFRDKNFGVLKSGAGFFVSNIGTRANRDEQKRLRCKGRPHLLGLN